MNDMRCLDKVEFTVISRAQVLRFGSGDSNDPISTSLDVRCWQQVVRNGEEDTAKSGFAYGCTLSSILIESPFALQDVMVRTGSSFGSLSDV